MKNFVLISSFLFCVYQGYAQGNVGVGTGSPHPSTILDVVSQDSSRGIGLPIINDSSETLFHLPMREGTIWVNPVHGFTVTGDHSKLYFPLKKTYLETCHLIGDTITSVFPPRPNAGTWAEEHALLLQARISLSPVAFSRFKRMRIFKKSPTGDGAYAVYSQLGSLQYTAQEWHDMVLENELTSICGDFSKHQVAVATVFDIPTINTSAGYHDIRRPEGHVMTLEEVVLPNGDTVHTLQDAMFDVDFAGLDSMPLDILKLAQFYYEGHLYDSVIALQSGELGLFLQNDKCPNCIPCCYNDGYRRVDSVVGSQFWRYKVAATRGIETYSSKYGCGCEEFREILIDYGVPDSMNLDCTSSGDPRDIIKVMIAGFRGTYDGYKPERFTATLDSLRKMQVYYGQDPCAGVHISDSVQQWPGITALLTGSQTFDDTCYRLLGAVYNQIRLVDSSLIGIVPIDTGWTSAEQAWRRSVNDSTGHTLETAAKFLALLGKEAGVDSVGLYYIGDTAQVMQVLTVFYSERTREYIGLDPITGTVLTDRYGKLWDLWDAALWLKSDPSKVWIGSVYFYNMHTNYLTVDSCSRNAQNIPWISPNTGTSYYTHIPGVVRIESARTMEQYFNMTTALWDQVRRYHNDPLTWSVWHDTKRSIACMQQVVGLPGFEIQMRQVWSIPW